MTDELADHGFLRFDGTFFLFCEVTDEIKESIKSH